MSLADTAAELRRLHAAPELLQVVNVWDVASAKAIAALHEHEDGLRAQLEEGLAELPGITVRSRASRRTPTLLMTFDGHAASDITQSLATGRVLAPSGNFYALEASRHLGLGDDGGLRVGLAPYTDASDVERLLEGLRAALG